MDAQARTSLAEASAKAASEGRIDEARRGFAAALAGDVRDVQVLFLGFQFHFRAGEYDHAQRLVEQRLDLLGRGTRSGDVARAFANLSLIHTFRGTLDEAESAAEMAIRVARESRHEYEESRGLHNLAMVHEKRGDLERAELIYREALVIAERIGADDLAASKLANLGDIALLRGRTDEARELWSRAVLLFERLAQGKHAREYAEKILTLDGGQKEN